MMNSDTEDEYEGTATKCLQDTARNCSSLSPTSLNKVQASLDQLYHSLSTTRELHNEFEHEVETRIKQLNMAAISIINDIRANSTKRYFDTLDGLLESENKNNNCPVNEDESPYTPEPKSPTKTSSAPLLKRESSAKSLKSRIFGKRAGKRKKCPSKRYDYVLVPLPSGVFRDVYTDIMTVIHHGVTQHKNVDALSAKRFDEVTTLKDSPSKRLYYVKPIPEVRITLEDLLKSKDRVLFTESQAKFLCANLLLAVKFLNDNDIVHGSLMPSKIIFNDRYYPEIAYFNSAEIFSERWSRFRTRMPLQYTAPEQCYEDIYENTDVFAVGIIVYEAIFGRPPHLGANDYETRKNLCDPKFVPTFDTSKISLQGKRFLRHCLRKSGEKRFDLTDMRKELFAEVTWFHDLDEDKIFDQTYPSPLAAKIHAFKKE